MIISFFTSCGHKQKGIFADNPEIVKNFVKEKELEPELFTENDIYAIGDIICLDNHVVFSIDTGNDFLYYAYNYEGDSIGTFIAYRGQGPNDLLTDVFCGQFYKDSVGIYMWINDVNQSRLCAIDVNQSLLSGKCSIDKSITTIPMAVNCFYSNDSLLIMEQRVAKNYNLLIKNLNSGAVLHKEPIYNYPAENAFGTYQSKWRIKSDGTKYVSAMIGINQINIGDFLTGQKKSLNIYNKISRLEDVIDKATGLQKNIYYCGIEITDDYIYALYMNQPYEDTFMKEKSMEVHVFSWDGDVICKFIIPQYITRFAVNETKEYILGWDHLNEKLYKYKFDKNIFR